MSVLNHYEKNGYLIGNHSYSHLVLDQVPTDRYIEDILLADSFLKTYNNYVPFFRYSELSVGKDKFQRDAVRKSLRDHSISIGETTLCAVDWIV